MRSSTYTHCRVIDSFQFICVCHLTYFYCVKNFGNLMGLNDLPWYVCSYSALLSLVTCFLLSKDMASEFPYIELESCVPEWYFLCRRSRSRQCVVILSAVHSDNNAHCPSDNQRRSRYRVIRHIQEITSQAEFLHLAGTLTVCGSVCFLNDTVLPERS